MAARQVCAVCVFTPEASAVRVEPSSLGKAGCFVQDVINFLYEIRGEMFYWAVMGLVLVWVCDLFGLWNRWGKRD
jgi:hypothetical protein